MVTKFKFKIQYQKKKIEKWFQKNSLFFISFYIGFTYVVSDRLYLDVLFASSV